MMTKYQDDALIVLAMALQKAKGPTAEAAYLLVDAVRRGRREEIDQRALDLGDLIT